MTVHYPLQAFHTDNELRSVRLHGYLAEQFGENTELAASTPREIVRALIVTRPGFADALRNGKYHVVIGDLDKGLEIDAENIDFSVGAGRTLHIIPAVEGRKDGGLGKILAGIALIGLAVVTGGTALMGIGFAGMTIGGTVGMVGLGLVVGGLATMLAPTPKLGDYSDREEEIVSYLMNGVVNTSEEGSPVPVAFGGPLMVGSHVISSGLDIEDMDLSNPNDYEGTGGGGGGGNYTGDFHGIIDILNPNSEYNQWLRDRYNNQQDTGISGYKGGKGGGQAKAAKETPNTAASEAVARVLDLISAGEIEGWADPTNPFRNIYLDETVVENSDGSRNFSGLEMHLRTGAPGQDYIPGFSQTENTSGVGVEVVKATPLTRSIASDPGNGLVINRVKVVMRFPALTEQNKENGDLTGASVSYRIGIIPNGGSVSWVTTQTLNEKFTSPYQKAHTIELPPGGHPYQVRVERLTNDSNDIALQNGTWWDAYVEIIDAKLAYPGSAMVGLVAFARQFGDRIPARGYMIKGVICEVPSNYDPIKRTYTGVWNGQFVRLWTNNPAWILWSALTDQEWGLGKRIPKSFVDKWTLYEIGVYSDKFVSDGLELPGQYIGTASENAVRKDNVRVATRTQWTSGNVIDGVTLAVNDRLLLMGQTNPGNNGIYFWTGSTLNRTTDTEDYSKLEYALVTVSEGSKKNRTYLQVNTAASQENDGNVWVSVHPRFQFNMWINSRENVYKAMQTIASNFRGMLIWGRGMVMSTQDAPKSPRRLITNANVHGGAFNYEGMGRKSIHTVALVTWVNPEDDWKANVEVVENPELIAKYGWRTVDVFAAGCTNRAQARRMGAWTLYTEQYESEIVSFRGSFEIADVVPGDVILLSDADQIGIRMGGRLKIGTSASSQTSVTLDAPFDFQSGQNYTLYLTGPDGTIYQKTVTNVAGKTDVITFSGAISDNHPQGEFNSVFILTSDILDPRLFRILAMSEQSDNEIEIIAAEHYPEKYAFVEEGISFDPRTVSVYDSTVPPAPPTNLTLEQLTITTAAGAREELQFKFDKSSSALVTEYKIRWRHNFGSWTEVQTITNNNKIPYAGPGQYDVIIYGIDVRGKETVPVSFSETFANERPIPVSSVQNLRVKGASVGVTVFTGSTLKFEWDVSAPSDYTGDNWEDPYFRDYQVRLEDGSGTVLESFYTTDRYFEITSEKYSEFLGSKSRTVRVSVGIRDMYGMTSSFASKTFTNPAPVYSDTPVTVSARQGRIYLDYLDPTDNDYSGIIVWASITSGFPTTDGYKVWDARTTPSFAWPIGQTVYLRWAFYDEFGKTSLSVSPETSIVSVGVSPTDLDTTAPSVPTGFGLSSALTLDNVNQQIIRLRASWSANGEADLSGYEIELIQGGGTPFIFPVSNATAFEWTVPANTGFTGRIRAVDVLGNRSSWSSTVSHTTTKDTTAPGVPTSVGISSAFSAFWISWTNVVAADLSSVEVYENTTNNSGTATLIDTVAAVSGAPGRYTRTGLASGVTRFYWTKSVDQSGNKSGFSSVVSATTATVSNIDIASGLQLPGYGDAGVPSPATANAPSLPATGNFEGRQYTNTNAADRKLYIYKNGAWSRAVDGADLTAGSLGYSAFMNSLRPPEIVSVLPSTANYQGRMVLLTTDNKLYRWTSATTTGTTFWTRATDGGDINAGSITGDRLVAGTITATYIGAGAITASKISVGDISNMVVDSGMTDPSSWIVGSGISFVGAASALGSQNAILIPATVDYKEAVSASIVVQPDKPYFFSSYLELTSGTPTFTGIYINWYTTDASGVETYLSQTYLGGSGTPSSFARHSAIINAPSTARRARLIAARVGGGTTSVYWAEPIVRRAANGELIVDGSITALKIQAGSITGDRIQAGTITTGLIAAGAITASKITIGDSSNMYPDPDLRDPGSMFGTYVGLVASGSAISSANIVYAAPNAVDTSCYSGYIPVEAGKPYYFKGVLSLGSGTPSLSRLIITWYSMDSAGVKTSLGNVIVGSLSTASTELAVSGTFTAPGTARVAQFVFYRTGGGTTYAYYGGPVMRRANNGELIVDGSIVTSHMTANTINADRLQVNTLTADRLTVAAGGDVSSNRVPVGIYVGTTGTTVGTMEGRASDPATRINAMSTRIDPGRILISGSTTLANWRNGTDTTLIEGGSIAANTIAANKITVGNRGISIQNIEFKVEASVVSWTAGYILWTNDAGSPAATFINAGSESVVSLPALYVYWVKGNSGLSSTSSHNIANVDSSNVVLAVWSGGTALVVNYGGTIITGDKIVTNTIDANKIIAGSITAREIKTASLTTEKLTITPGNLLANSDFATGDTTDWRPWAGSMAVGNYGYGSSKYWMRYYGTAGTSGCFSGSKAYSDTDSQYSGFEVRNGDEFFVSIDVLRGVSTTMDNFVVFLYFQKTDGSLPSTQVTWDSTGSTALSPALTNAATTYTGRVKVEAINVYRAWAYVYCSNLTGEVYWTRLRINRKSDANLIVDGAIQARHVSAQSITADKIVIGASDSLLQNGEFKGTAEGWSLSSATGMTVSKTTSSSTTWPSPNAILFSRSASTGTGVLDSFVSPYVAGSELRAPFSKLNEEFLIEGTSWYSATGIPQYCQMLHKDRSGNVTPLPAQSAVGLNITAPTASFFNGTASTYNQFSVVFKNTVGEGSIFLRFVSEGAGGAASGQSWYLWNLLMRRRQTGSLIVNGSIHASKLIVDSIVVKNLQIGAGITLGGGMIRVALRPFRVPVYDGQVVTFPFDLESIPLVTYEATQTLAQPSSSQSFDLRANSLTSTGFTAYLKRVAPGTPTTVTSGPGASSGSGPEWQMDKSAIADSNNGYYNIRIKGTIRVQRVVFDNGGGGMYLAPEDGYSTAENYSGISVSTWFNSGSGWVQGPDIWIDAPFASGSSGFYDYSFDQTTNIQWNNAIGQHGAKEFGISVAYRTFSATYDKITEFTSVTYSGATSTSAVTASPSGETCVAVISPSNT